MQTWNGPPLSRTTGRTSCTVQRAPPGAASIPPRGISLQAPLATAQIHARRPRSTDFPTAASAESACQRANIFLVLVLAATRQSQDSAAVDQPSSSGECASARARVVGSRACPPLARQPDAAHGSRAITRPRELKHAMRDRRARLIVFDADRITSALSSEIFTRANARMHTNTSVVKHVSTRAQAV